MKELLMDLTVRRLAALAAAAAMTTGAGAAIAPVALADSGQMLLEVGRLSDGTPGGNPAAALSGLDYNEGAGGKFGVTSPSRFNSSTFTFSPPAGTTIAGSRVWPLISAYGWPAMGTYSTVTSSWGNWNVGGNPGSASIAGLWAQGGGGYTTGAVGSLTASANQPSSGSGSEQTGYFYTDKLDVTLADSNPPAVDDAPATGQLFGAPDASGWYTGATLPVTLKASDQGGGVRWMLIKDGSTVHKYALPGTGASCATKDPNASLMGGDTYTVKVPCPTASASYTVNVDMTGIGDGAHSLQLGVMDASGRSTYGAAYTANVNAPGLNPAPGGGSGLPDAGDVGPGGCIYQADGTTCVVPIANTGVPTITGTAKVGQVLTAGDGTWTGAAGATFTYQWERKGALGVWDAIPSASARSYTLTSSDEGLPVRVKVTATVGGSSQSAYSDPSGAVAPAGGGSGGNGSGGGGGGGGGGGKPTDPPSGPTAAPGGGDPTPAPGPSGPPEAPHGAPNGTPATRDATVTATFASNGKRAIAAKYATGLRVRGTVKTAKGAPIANATVVIRARNTVPGAKPGKVATTKTDSKGRYETTIARGPSRKVTVSYTAFGGDAEPADSASVTVKVAAAAKLATNVRTVRVGQALKLSGRLVHPQAGVMVLMCATDAGKWRSFDHVRTDRRGRFHYTYKFKPGSEGRSYGFSVLVDDRVYPFLAGYSNKVNVKVAR
jgi:hypothetical protein